MKGHIKYFMKLKELHIMKLHKMYNYDVEFNEDVTFIFGTNGCGKTTILNITEAIITGQLFKLFEYKFDKIVLKYYSTKKFNQVREIVISAKNKTLDVQFEETNYSITKMRVDVDSIEEVAQKYMDRYNILSQIRRSFNYIYLPLDRMLNSKNSLDSFDNSYMYYSRSMQYHLFDNFDENSIYIGQDRSIDYIEKMIYSKYNIANSEIRKIENDFRTKVLRDLLNVDAYANTDELITALIDSRTNRISSTHIERVKNQYIAILRDLSSDELEIQNCENFFKLLENNMTTDGDVDISAWFRYHEFSRIKKTIALAEKTSSEKDKVMKKFALLVDTMNDFILETSDEKRFVITQSGEIGFRTKFSNEIVNVHNLSSGEKQLLLFFAHLIFRVDSGKTGIFVVDEPEISLHLTWQKKFVERIIDINPKIQLIFATHSPEFIGRYRDKMFKLEKKLVTGT